MPSQHFTTPKAWVDYPQVSTPLQATDLLRIEAGIVAVDTLLSGNLPAIAAATNCGFACQGTAAAGTAQTTYKVRHLGTAAASGTRLVYSNGYSSNGTYSDGPGAVTVRASVYDGSSGYYRVTFNGRRDVTIDPGCVAISDPLGAPIKPGVYFYTQTAVSGASGWPLGNATTDGANLEGNGAGDLTLTQTGINGAFAYAYGPSAILSEATTSLPAVYLVGDSIMYGQGDGPAQNYGFSVRALNAAGIGWTMVASPGEKATQFSQVNVSESRLHVLHFHTHAIYNYDINDVKAGVTTATLQAALIAAWQRLSPAVAVYQCTMTPCSTSSDNFATLAGQTPIAQASTRATVNDWIRAGAPVTSASNLTAVAVGTGGALTAGQPGHPLTGYFETADTVESARNSCLWKVNGTAQYTTGDGTHPTSVGHALMAAAIDVSKFTR